MIGLENSIIYNQTEPKIEGLERALERQRDATQEVEREFRDQVTRSQRLTDRAIAAPSSDTNG